MTGRLDVWLYGTRIAHLDRTRHDRLALTWADEGRERWPVGQRVLSAKLPVDSAPSPALVRAYLDGLLPEGNARTNHAMGAGVAPDDTLGLIQAYGRDTPGAAIFVEADAGDPTQEGHYEPITLAELAERLHHADSYSPARFEGTLGESSTLPGMVPKITVHRDETGWYACKDGAPSTWILKRAFPADSEARDVVDTEVACLALARELGLTTVDAEVIDFGEQRAIAVSRFDRPSASMTRRLHQEDLAQALGLNTSDPNRKFQFGARTPSLVEAADVLRRDGGDVSALLRLAVFSHLVGNTDMHAKNISFLRLPDGRTKLAPAYDIAMHLHHRRGERRSALDVNQRFLMAEISLVDFVDEATTWGLPRRRTVDVVQRTAKELGRALESTDRGRFPGVCDDAWAQVSRRVAQALSPDR